MERGGSLAGTYPGRQQRGRLESLQYFQRQLGESGILDALVEKGVEENDTVLIGEYQFDYIF